jgi:hypothetical protein
MILAVELQGGPADADVEFGSAVTGHAKDLAGQTFAFTQLPQKRLSRVLLTHIPNVLMCFWMLASYSRKAA